MERWEVKINGETKAYGSEKSFPTAQERRIFKADGYKVFVDGKVYQEENKKGSP